MPILAWITRREVQYLAQQDKKSTYSEMVDSHTKQKKISKPTTIKRPRTEQLLFIFLPVENPPFSSIYMSQRNFFNVHCIRAARTKSPHRASTRAGHVLMRSLPLLYGSPPRRGESEPSPGGRLPTLRFSSCGQEHSFHY